MNQSMTFDDQYNGSETNMTLSALSFISQDSKETCGWDLGFGVVFNVETRIIFAIFFSDVNIRA